MITGSMDAMGVIFSFLSEVQCLKMQNLSRRFYDSILARIFYSCPVEWRQNGRAVIVAGNAIRIEDFENEVIV